MQIESIRLRNFKSFRDVTLTNLPRFCILVGANGTGKTTLFDLFGFLKDCLTFNVTRALQNRGGFDEVISRGVDKEEAIGIEIQFRMPITDVNRLVTYLLEIKRHDRQIVVHREILRYKRGVHGSPYHFLDFSNGSGRAVTNEQDFNKTKEKLTPEDQTLDKADILAVKGLGQFERFKAANALRRLIENWHISDFHIKAARGSKDASGYVDHLSVTGDNLQLVANRMFENNDQDGRFALIIERMKRRVPGIEEIEPEQTRDGRLLLKFKDGSFQDPFIDKYVSDGTLKMFAYLTLLYDPAPHPLLCVEEPENQLYPKLLWELAEEFRAYAHTKKEGQVFVSTHSPAFLNAARVEEVFWLVKKNGYTQVKRAQEDPQISAYMAQGDQMGALWEQGLFTEADPQ
ncbi:MAG: AAA family ATPase [Magnetococcales bacterium]|nr:AAA family ATPase [Magnetococcales bacterium]